jgi:hypothetical protein
VPLTCLLLDGLFIYPLRKMQWQHDSRFSF